MTYPYIKELMAVPMFPINYILDTEIGIKIDNFGVN